MASGKIWTVRDRYGNDIYLSAERWRHVIDPDNHPEMMPYLDAVAATVQQGRRRQDVYDPNSYQYFHPFPDLPDKNSHVVVCVRFRWSIAADGSMNEEKFVTTAYFQVF